MERSQHSIQYIDYQVRAYRGCQTKLETDFDNGLLRVSETYFSWTLAFRQSIKTKIFLIMTMMLDLFADLLLPEMGLFLNWVLNIQVVIGEALLQIESWEQTFHLQIIWLFISING